MENEYDHKEIWKTAFRTRHNCQFKKTEETHRSIYYEVEDEKSHKIHTVGIVYFPHQKVTLVKCDCMLQSIKVQYMPLCAHIIAVVADGMFVLGRQQPRKRKVEDENGNL